MKRIVSIGIVSLLIFTSIFMFSATRELNRWNDISMFPQGGGGGNDEELAAFERTYSLFNLEPYPKDLGVTRRLLSKVVGENRTDNGTLKYPAIYIRKLGRLGNNILQLSNAIYLSEVMNVSTIYIPKGFCRITRNVTTSKGIRIAPTKRKPEDALALHRELYGMTSGGYCPEDRVYEFAGETLRGVPRVKTGANELYVHVRSGDIFGEKINKYYGQPPLCFYEGIIKRWGFRRVYILTEDTRNPVIAPLVLRHKAKLIKADLPQTIGYVLGARNLVLSFGTFLPALLRLVPDGTERKKGRKTTTTRRIFRYGNRLEVNSVVWKRFYFTEPSEYYTANLLSENWNNTREQLDIMVNETCGDVWKVSMHTNYSSQHGFDRI